MHATSARRQHTRQALAMKHDTFWFLLRMVPGKTADVSKKYELVRVERLGYELERIGVLPCSQEHYPKVCSFYSGGWSALERLERFSIYDLVDFAYASLCSPECSEACVLSACFEASSCFCTCSSCFCNSTSACDERQSHASEGRGAKLPWRLL